MSTPRMKNVGIRIQRYRLQRYRPPERISERARLLLTVALAGWLIWALFLSDHSAVRIFALQRREAGVEAKLAQTQREVDDAGRDLDAAQRPEVAEQVLRERHNFAKDGELLYVIGGDGTARPAGADSSGR
jgi:cell division protein FtsB